MKTIGFLASANSNQVAQSRIEFIKTNFSEKLHLNPYTSPDLIKEIKIKMMAVGLCGPNTAICSANIDSAVINYFNKAKGKPVLKNYRSSRSGRNPVNYGY